MWCAFTVNGGASSTATSTTFTFPAGTVVNLHADKASAAFDWGYWFGTDGDTSATHDTAMSTTVTMTTSKKVQACCPVHGTGTPCPPPT
jgi:hypothetical protein